MNNINIIVPVYNEEENVVPLAEEIAAAARPLGRFEIIMVDDASTDSTIAQLTDLQNKLPELRIVQHQENRGQSNAVVTGVYAANNEWIATLDGDGQNDPADIPKLLEAAMQQHNKHVLWMGHRTQRKDNGIRKLSTKIANGIRGALLKDNCPDSGCGIKVFTRSTFLRLPHFRNCHRFMPALFRRAGASILNIPVHHRPRLRGQSKYGILNRLGVGIVDLVGVAWLMRRPITVDTENDISTS